MIGRQTRAQSSEQHENYKRVDTDIRFLSETLLEHKDMEILKVNTWKKHPRQIDARQQPKTKNQTK